MGKIVLFVAKEEMLHMAHNILQERNYSIDEIKVIQTKDAVTEAQNAVAEGAEIVIARGLQASLIKQYTDIPVVQITMTAQEIGLLIKKAKQILHKDCPAIALVGLSNMFCDMSYFDILFDIHLQIYYAENKEQLRQMTEDAIENMADLIIGGEVVVKTAQEHQIPSLFLSVTEDSLKTAFSMAEKMYYAINAERHNTAQIETLQDYSSNGIIRLDMEGSVVDINPAMEEILGCEKSQIIGQKLKQIIKSLDEMRVDQVHADGEEIYSFFTHVNKIPVYAVLVPVKLEGHIYGAILTCHKAVLANAVKDRKGFVAGGTFSDIFCLSEKMKKCIETAKLLSQSNSALLLLGEVGTETELVAQAIHNHSVRVKRPYIQINCSCLEPGHQQEQMFGEKGIIENCQGGTLLLQEFEYLTPSSQHQVLEIICHKIRIDYHTMQQVWADVRILLSASVPPEQCIVSGRWDQQLFYALSPFIIEIPPLRERREDLKAYANLFVRESCERYARYHVLTNAAVNMLTDYQWKGNLIELKSFCDRLVLNANKRNIDEKMVNRTMKQVLCWVENKGTENNIESSSNEKDWILQILNKNMGNRKKTARELGISETTLWRRMRKYDI